jgi:hypothetical protein
VSVIFFNYFTPYIHTNLMMATKTDKDSTGQIRSSAMAEMGDVQDSSQTSSHFALDPIQASVLCEREAKRRDQATKLGSCRTGCPEVDERVLLGGFERGSVVGISAEEEGFGLLVGVTLRCFEGMDEVLVCQVAGDWS